MRASQKKLRLGFSFFMNKTFIGKYGEELAAKYLQNLGYKIIEKNFRIRGGEIDIVAQDEKTLVYVEVKTRSTNKFGKGEESVNFWKMKFLERAAKFYRLKRKNLPDLERIDVLAVDLSQEKPSFNLIRNASQ